ncbi:MAG: nucleotide-binding universal stress UspA family protein [Maribacter sp.]|jgi:nucleotide-binding universal stress UspA family protein
MQNIVIPIDFLKQLEYAFKVAASIAKKYTATLYALHMLEMNEALISSNEGA